MHVLYDTRLIHPLDRYEYYRAGVNTEIARVEVHGHTPGHLFTTMSVARIGDFEITTHSWSSDSEIVAWRTERSIRACDPECYRIFLLVNGEIRAEQAGNQVDFRSRDIALYDTSHPWRAIHPTGPGQTQLAMLTFPRTLIPIIDSKVRPLIGTVMPRNMRGRSLIAQFLTGLADTADLTEDPDLTHALHECAVGLIRQRLGRPDGITPRTRQLLHMAHIRNIICRNLDNPGLDPSWIADAANISQRYLHQLFQGTELTPMQLVKRLRLQECNRSLRDPALGARRIKEIIAAHGYGRLDQFSRDFRQMFGVSAREVRGLHSPTGPEDEPRGLEPASAGTHQDQSRCRRTTMPSQNNSRRWSSDD